MVGNPYPSALDWDSPSITKTGINNAIYIWNPDLQQFASYVFGIGTNGGSNIIASSQAFWVQTNSVLANITLTEYSKSTNQGSFLKTGNTVNPFKIKAQNNYGTDELVINFNNNATNNFDANYDALKMGAVNTNLPSISSVMNNVDYSINQLPAQEINIPIKLVTGVTGLQTISVENVSSLINASCLYLEDLFTGLNYNLSTTSSFTAYIYDTTTTARFLLKIGAPKNTDITNVSCYGSMDGSIILNKLSNNSFSTIWKNNAGTILKNSNNVMMADTLNNIPSDIYTIETSDQLCGNLIDTVFVSEPPAIISSFNAPDTVFINNGANAIFTNNSQNVSIYNWNFGDGFSDNQMNTNHIYTQVGTYIVTLTAYQTQNCYNSFYKNIVVSDNTMGIDSFNSNEDIKTWINKGFLNIQFQNNKNYQLIELRNMLGQIVYQNNAINNKNLSIDISKLSDAFYTLTVLDRSNQAKSFKIANIK